ncbi:heat-inducible transcriptional repressor HrcA [Brevibacterium sp. SMBL_HHYL_HB1]|uniref:heat-inducible transcriptional repressor HrcA n=1 Tax=Brevibacterium sp. SMBL_HHYL_HB1 TaxID=2777556 RepID=UPI001BAB3CB6|nr:heat-inducible transcriptional repressor HrcA [Brevibacterium sp. SMBL_HHYL_HB1]QUL80320.1 heat-inducible transcriptional repressor HrcA [Brevibacterium sp. SMBL_HHYL_HB1]
MNDSRRAQVLRAIVEDFVATNEPVGSKAIVHRHTLGVSPATIRNDMAHLEQEGYIAQPHTSAGRIPTDLGYRMFVDRIDEFKPLTQAERRAIFQLIDGDVDLDEMLDRTVRVLSGLTHQVALIQYPTVSLARIKHIEIVGLGPSRVLVVLITDAGQVEQKTVTLSQLLDDGGVREIRDRINSEFAGKKLSHVAGEAAGAERTPTPAEAAGAEAVDPDEIGIDRIRAAVIDLVAATREERIIMAGTANLARSGHEFGEQMAPILEAFEEQVVLLKLLTSMAEDQEEISVRIGRENTHESFSSTSVVAAEYGHDAGSSARLAVLGPTRMDYPTTISAVRAVAKYVSSLLDRG